MAERSGFFNALYTNGEYDRKYNANDYTDNLAVVIGNGVLRGVDDDLKVTANGMSVTVGTGRAWINGHYYYNDAALSFAAVSAPAGGTRWDRVMLRLNTEVGTRSVKLRYAQGTAATEPQKPAPVRSGDIYELVLADVFVGTNATRVQVTDTRADLNVCGWVYSTRGNEAFFQTLDNAFAEWFAEKKDTLSSVTLFKRYEWRTVLEAATDVTAFNIPQYDETSAMLEVYVNGLRVTEGDDFTRSGSVLTFPFALIGGTEIEVVAYKSIDGTGILSVAQEITELQNQVADINAKGDYEYVCNGVTDNEKISELALTWLNGGDDYGSKTIRVYGTFGARAPVGGFGDMILPYYWFEIGGADSKKRKVIIDFSCCSELNISVDAGSANYIFYGKDVHIIGADVNVYEKSDDTIIVGFSSVDGAVCAENCRFWLTGHNTCKVACTGTFTNCRASVANSTGRSVCFDVQTNALLRLNGGEYMAYSGTQSAVIAVVGHGASATKATSILNGVNAPTVTRSGYYQANSIHQESGAVSCHDLISTLAVKTVAGSSNVTGTIGYSKAGNM